MIKTLKILSTTNLKYYFQLISLLLSTSTVDSIIGTLKIRSIQLDWLVEEDGFIFKSRISYTKSILELQPKTMR